MMHASDVCLSDACRVHRAYKSITERPRKAKIGREVARVTRDSDTTFEVKGQDHQTALVGCSSHHIIYLDASSLYTTVQSHHLYEAGA